MGTSDILAGKRILAVDDEPEILDLIREALNQCDVSTAASFEDGEQLIQTQDFDLVLLDIMGVRGFELLELCGNRKMPAAVLTAHSIDVDSLNRSLKLGAVSFLPKDELVHLPELVAEIFEGLRAKRSHWPKLFDRLGPFFKSRLNVVWEDIEQPPGAPPFY